MSLWFVLQIRSSWPEGPKDNHGLKRWLAGVSPTSVGPCHVAPWSSVTYTWTSVPVVSRTASANRPLCVGSAARNGLGEVAALTSGTTWRVNDLPRSALVSRITHGHVAPGAWDAL